MPVRVAAPSVSPIGLRPALREPLRWPIQRLAMRGGDFVDPMVRCFVRIFTISLQETDLLQPPHLIDNSGEIGIAGKFIALRLAGAFRIFCITGSELFITLAPPSAPVPC